MGLLDFQHLKNVDVKPLSYDPVQALSWQCVLALSMLILWSLWCTVENIYEACSTTALAEDVTS
jgi:hypothetical protein